MGMKRSFGSCPIKKDWRCEKAMTIQDFLEYPFLYHAKLLAGSSGCYNEITFCMPSSELLSEHWIMPGAAFLFTQTQTLTFPGRTGPICPPISACRHCAHGRISFRKKKTLIFSIAIPYLLFTLPSATVH